MTKGLTLAILCGGKGTRLGELTSSIPKSLVRVNGKPFVYHQLMKLDEVGFKEIVLCVGHMSEQIMSYVCRLPLATKVSFSIETTPLGTGGALIQAHPMLGDTFFTTYGDSYLDTRHYKKMWKRMNDIPCVEIMLSLTKTKNTNNVVVDEYSLIRSVGGKQSANYADYGISLIRKGCLSTFNHAVSIDLNTIYDFFSHSRDIVPYFIKGRFYEIGTPESLRETEEYLFLQERKLKNIKSMFKNIKFSKNKKFFG